MKTSIRALLLTMLLTLSLSSVALAAEPDRHARPDSGGGTKSTVPLPQAAAGDTSMLTGSGLNTTAGPIDRPVAGGAWRKDPGGRTWYFIRGISDAEMKLEHERFLEELVREHGHEPRDIVIAAKDTTDVRKLRGFSIAVKEALPCTLNVRVLYRQLPEMKKAGLNFWGKGDRRPGTGADKRLTLPPRPPGPPRPDSTKPVPPAPAAQRNDLLSTQAVAFSDGFEIYAVPGTNWTAGDLRTDGPYYDDYWGDLSLGYADVRSGSWSVSCSAHGDAPFFSYDNDQDSWMQNPYFIDMSGYSQYTASFWVRLDSQYNHDFFRAYYSTGGTWQPWYAASGDSAWRQRTLTVPNSGHLNDDFAFLFKFESDLTGIFGSGAYVDDVLLDGTLSQPNLTFWTAPGWSAPIVPSSVTGTTTTGTLYAGQPTYIDWAIQNNGTANTSNTFYIDYYLDGAYIGSDTRFGLDASTGYTRTDWSYTVPTAGNHTLSMVIDPTGAVTESNESDNTYQQSFYWQPGSVTVSGTFAYDDSLLGAGRPLRCARVVLRDSDGGGAVDDSLTETYTNPSGQWGPITLTNRDTDADQGRLDLYARVYLTTRGSALGDSVVGVKDYYGERWYIDTPVVTNIANGTYAYGTVKPTDYGPKTAAHLYTMILRGYDDLKALGTVPPFVSVRWTPGDGFTTAYLSNTVWVQGKYSYYPTRFWPDEWDDGVVLHEYGHHVAAAFGFQQPISVPYTHRPDTTSRIAPDEESEPTIPSPVIAFREGWCWYFAGQVLGTQAITNWGDSLGMKTRDTLDVERGIYWDSITNRLVNVNDRGDAWEGVNAGVLWDVADAVDDNQNGDNFSDHLTSSPSAVWSCLSAPGDTLIRNIYSFFNVFWPRYAGPVNPHSSTLLALIQVYGEHGAYPLVLAVPGADPGPLSWGRVRGWPNPFCGSTAIRLRAPASASGGQVSLHLYDVAGHRVRTLLNGPLQAGEHTLKWDGTSQHGQALPAGVYYGKLDGPGVRQTFKLLLLK